MNKINKMAVVSAIVAVSVSVGAAETESTAPTALGYYGMQQDLQALIAAQQQAIVEQQQVAAEQYQAFLRQRQALVEQQRQAVAEQMQAIAAQQQAAAQQYQDYLQQQVPSAVASYPVPGWPDPLAVHEQMLQASEQQQEAMLQAVEAQRQYAEDLLTLSVPQPLPLAPDSFAPFPELPRTADAMPEFPRFGDYAKDLMAERATWIKASEERREKLRNQIAEQREAAYARYSAARERSINTRRKPKEI